MAYSRVALVQRRKTEAEVGREHGVAMGRPAAAGRLSQAVVATHPGSAGVLAEGERQGKVQIQIHREQGEGLARHF
ncbi:hypothetical protein C2855_03445 [Aeromonas bestiarum]|nr:hypothetical protein C2855_03445 [Aeromonas bestiarum]